MLIVRSIDSIMLQMFFVTWIIVVGNGVADLDFRNVYIVVPPHGGIILI